MAGTGSFDSRSFGFRCEFWISGLVLDFDEGACWMLGRVLDCGRVWDFDEAEFWIWGRVLDCGRVLDSGWSLGFGVQFWILEFGICGELWI